RRRWVVALVFATALIFALAGLGSGYALWHEGQGESGECLLYRAIIQDRGVTTTGATSEQIATALQAYDQFCR
ncbi:MAG: hypothetical protein ABI559_11010, partial [Chloroflexota bacterium]